MRTRKCTLKQICRPRYRRAVLPLRARGMAEEEGERVPAQLSRGGLVCRVQARLVAQPPLEPSLRESRFQHGRVQRGCCSAHLSQHGQ